MACDGSRRLSTMPPPRRSRRHPTGAATGGGERVWSGGALSSSGRLSDAGSETTRPPWLRAVRVQPAGRRWSPWQTAARGARASVDAWMGVVARIRQQRTRAVVSSFANPASGLVVDVAAAPGAEVAVGKIGREVHTDPWTGAIAGRPALTDAAQPRRIGGSRRHARGRLPARADHGARHLGADPFPVVGHAWMALRADIARADEGRRGSGAISAAARWPLPGAPPPHGRCRSRRGRGQRAGNQVNRVGHGIGLGTPAGSDRADVRAKRSEIRRWRRLAFLGLSRHRRFAGGAMAGDVTEQHHRGSRRGREPRPGSDQDAPEETRRERRTYATSSASAKPVNARSAHRGAP